MAINKLIIIIGGNIDNYIWAQKNQYFHNKGKKPYVEYS